MSDPNKDINQWINIADHDLGTAKLVFLHLPEYYETISFHCQQAVEKYLKALLIHFDIEFSKKHDLIYLLELLSAKIEIENSQMNKAVTLNSYSVQIRYPNIIEKLTEQDLISAIEISEEFRNFTIEILGFE